MYHRRHRLTILRVLGAVWGLLSYGALARNVPYETMDSLALHSELVALTEELGFRKNQQKQGEEPWTVGKTGRYRVVRVFKGDVSVGQEIEALVSFWHVRRPCRWPPKNSILKPASVRTPDENEVPLARALLFLQKAHDEGTEWEALTGGIKVILQAGVLCYLQADSNPGPLVLIDQLPEFIEIGPVQRYREAELLRDLEIALANPRGLKEPFPISPLAILEHYGESGTLRGLKLTEDIRTGLHFTVEPAQTQSHRKQTEPEGAGDSR